MDYQNLIKILPKDPKRWKQDDVTIWLEFIGLKDLDEKFRQNSADGAVLSVLSDNDLEGMGLVENKIKLKKLQQWIQVGFKEYSDFLREGVTKQSINLQTSQIYKKSSIKPQVTFADDNQFQEEHINSRNSKLQQQYPSKDLQQQQQQQLSQQLQEEVQQVKSEIIVPPRMMDTTKVPILQPQQKKPLLIIHNLQDNKSIRINYDQFIIGRNPDNQLVLKEDYISRQHCKIFFKQQNGNYYLQDMGSSSGTYVQLFNPTLLKEGLILHLGQAQYLILKIELQQMTCHVYIKIVDGSLAGKEIDFKLTMDQSAMIFGRNLAILSDDTMLSAQHCQFTYIKEGLVIEDLESLNGTWLRLSEAQQVSEPIRLIHNRRFRLAYEQYFDCELN